MLLWGGCVRDHASPGDSSSSGSNWLRCQDLADCSESYEAVACRSDGFCADSRGERISVRATAGGGHDAQVAMPPSGSDAAVPAKCAWGVDELLREAGVIAPNRRNCGWYWSTTSPSSLAGALTCFDSAIADEAAVQISFNWCGDCWMRTTHVVTEGGEHFEIVMEDDGFGDDQREATVRSCEAFVSDAEQLGPTCSGPVTRYACSEPRSVSRELPADPPVEPFKLTDLPAASVPTVLHLYVSNQSFAEPLVDIALSLADVQVVAGDFAVEGQHTWYSFDIVVPAGTLRLDALSFGVDEAVHFSQEISVPEERWAVVGYWYDPEESEGPHFTLTLSSTPVFFD
jgi:hypothetical protein